MFSPPKEVPGAEQWLPKCFAWIIPCETEVMESLVKIATGVDFLSIMCKRLIVFSEVAPTYDVA